MEGCLEVENNKRALLIARKIIQVNQTFSVFSLQ